MYEKMDAAILNQLCNYCAYRERCIKEVREKLTKLQVPKEEHSVYLQKLIDGKYLNEWRFAKAYASGHVRKGWGKQKIKMGLAQKQVNSAAIETALAELDESGYADKLHAVAHKKWNTIKGETIDERKIKLTKFLLGKGYEYTNIKEAIKALSD